MTYRLEDFTGSPRLFSLAAAPENNEFLLVVDNRPYRITHERIVSGDKRALCPTPQVFHLFDDVALIDSSSDSLGTVTLYHPNDSRPGLWNYAELVEHDAATLGKLTPIKVNLGGYAFDGELPKMGKSGKKPGK